MSHDPYRLVFFEGKKGVVSAIHTPQRTTEVDQLRTEVTRLQELVKSLSIPRRHLDIHLANRLAAHLALPRHAFQQIPRSAGTIKNLVMLPRSVENLVPGN